MIRTVIHINEELCSGCGLCASACKEGAIAMVNGKARLIRDDYCDGLGDCLPACPTGSPQGSFRYVSLCRQLKPCMSQTLEGYWVHEDFRRFHRHSRRVCQGGAA